jgi:hypothetical protein
VKHRLACLAVVLSLALGTTAIAQAVSLRLDGNTFEVFGWKPPSSPPASGWASLLTVYAGGNDVTPMLGSYAIENGALVFRAAYPLAAGVGYRAVFRPPGGAVVEKTFDGPARRAAATATRVERVYPSADTLPSNQLRLYIYFSAPMSRGEAEQRIHLLDADGKTLGAVFLPGQELWDPDNRRLTMTFDPGRIKRGLRSNESMGAPIAEGRRYTLVIDAGWRDANGVPLAGTFRKEFRGGPATRQPPDPKTWRVAAPAAGTRDPLVVSFDRPMNYTLLQRMLLVADEAGNVTGSVEVDRQETQWRFTPQSPWRPGAHRLVVNTALEDLAGNRIGEPFDIDVFERVTGRIATTTTTVPFVIGR